MSTSSSAASSPIASQSPGMPTASGKPDSRVSVEPSSLDAASTSQVRLKDENHGGLMEEQRWDPLHQEGRIWEDSDNPAAETTKENLLPKTIKLGGNPLHTEPVLELTRKVKRIRKRRGTTISTYRRTHRTTWKPSSPWSGRSLETNQRILWKIWMWTWLFGKYSWIPLFGQQFKSRERLWHEFEICIELSLENNRTAFQGNRRADQWSDRNHWHEPHQFPRFKVGIEQAYCTVELINLPLPRSMSSTTLCSVWEKWETILLNPGRSKFNGIQTTIASANQIELMDSQWNSSGRFFQDSPQWESSMRFNRWWEN